MIYYYYSKYDLLKEDLGKKEFSGYREALHYFSGVKHLPPTEFLNLFEITNKSHEERKSNSTTS